MTWVAHERPWCLDPECTTCSGQDFRRALRRLDRDHGLGFGLVDALKRVDIGELIQIPNWSQCLRIALHELPLPGQAASVIKAWLSLIRNELEFVDHVLFDILCRQNVPSDIRQQWIGLGVRLAIESEDGSLMESMLIAYPNAILGNYHATATAQWMGRRHVVIEQLLKRHDANATA